jgi:hypothetical protein
MQTSKDRLFGRCSDHIALPLVSDSLVLRTLLTYPAARAGRIPCRAMRDTDLGALRNFLVQHPDLDERCRATEDELSGLARAVGGV